MQQHNRHGIPILPHHRRVQVRQCWKRRHPTREAAYDHLVLHATQLGDPTLKVYRCPWCRDAEGNYGWHIGHPPEVKP